MQKRILALSLIALGSTYAAPACLYFVHDEEGPIKALAAFFESKGYCTVVQHENEFRPHLGSISPRALFLYVHAVLKPDLETFLIKHTREGGRLIIVHHGLASAKARNERFMEFLGMRITRDLTPKWAVWKQSFDLVNLNPEHFVTTRNMTYPKTVSYSPSDMPSAPQKLSAFEFVDTELFVNMMFTDGRQKTVLFGVRAERNGELLMQDRGGWLLRSGKGHVFYFQPGHFARDFENAAYAQILLNAVEWTPSQ